MRHEEIVLKGGVLKDKDFAPKEISFVSKGCTRCPDFYKRDDRKSITDRNRRTIDNHNYGD